MNKPDIVKFHFRKVYRKLSSHFSFHVDIVLIVTSCTSKILVVLTYLSKYLMQMRKVHKLVYFHSLG